MPDPTKEVLWIYMSSKQVTDRQKSADAVVAIGLAQADDIGAALAPLLAPLLEQAESLPDIPLVIRLLARLLDKSKQLMIQADHTHTMELGDDPAVRDARDAAAEKLIDALVNLRYALSGVYGQEIASQVMKNATPRDPVVLMRHTDEVMESLSAAALPAPKFAGTSLDKQNVIATLTQKKSDLGSRLEAVTQEVKEAQISLDAKNKAIAIYDERFAPIAGLFERALQLSGKPELAQKVKPSIRKAGVVEEEPSQEPSEPNPPPVSPS